MDAAKGAPGTPAVTANFVAVHNITTSATPAAGGTITASQVAKHGSSPTLTIIPTVTATARYGLASLTDNATTVTAIAVAGAANPTFTYTVPNIAADHAIAANFIQQFILTPSLSAGGTVTPATAQTVDSGTTRNFTITANPGFRIGSVLVDNAAMVVPAAATTFQVQLAAVAADHSIQAAFVKIWNVVSTVAGNGSVDKSGTIVVDDGTTPSYTFTPSSNKFQAGKILVDNVPQAFTKPVTISGAISFALPPVKTDKTVSATFVPSGDLDENGAVEVADALKALKIFVNLQTPDITDKAAMKIGPLDAAGVPTGGAGDPDLNDIILILKKAVGIVNW